MVQTQARLEYAIETNGLGKSYRSFWALNNCTITVPKGEVTALIGPNGAGKTTLLKLLAGLSRPSAGMLTMLGQAPAQTTEYLSQIGYLAQEIPLYDTLSAQDHLAIGAHMDAHWDNDLALKRLNELRIPLDRPVGKLSGGQRAQVGLAVTLAKKPKLLLLDEPVAALDPLARTDFLASLTQAVTDANGDLTVIMSSHLLDDLERICDNVIILAAGETQLCDSIEHTLETHKLLVGAPDKSLDDPGYKVVKAVRSATATHLLVKLNAPSLQAPGWHMRDVDIEEIVLAYMSQSRDAVKNERGVR